MAACVAQLANYFLLHGMNTLTTEIRWHKNIFDYKLKTIIEAKNP